MTHYFLETACAYATYPMPRGVASGSAAFGSMLAVPKVITTFRDHLCRNCPANVREVTHARIRLEYVFGRLHWHQAPVLARLRPKPGLDIQVRKGSGLSSRSKPNRPAPRRPKSHSDRFASRDTVSFAGRRQASAVGKSRAGNLDHSARTAG